MHRRLQLLKRLLAIIIRADVQGASPCGPDARRMYLLPRTSLTDLAVLSNACALERENCVFLSEEVGWCRRRSLMRGYPQRLHGAHQLALIGAHIEIVPVSVFWSRSAGYETSLAKLLLSERWVPTSRMRRFLEVLVNRKMVQVVFAPPINLGALLAGQTDPKRALRRTARLARVVFKNQRLALLGPELSLKSKAMTSVLSQAEVRVEIERRAASLGETQARAEKHARRILRKMVSDFSAITLRVVYRFARWSWKWAGASFEIRGLEGVRTHAQAANLVYLPCHQSHLDYIVLSYLLYDQGLSLPHIAAGENLNLPVLGRLLRQCGAFFIRRSFRDDDLYRSLITHYLRLILMRGHTVEFFLEGTRSRTGFLMPARHGMLQVALSAAAAAPPRPLALVPVRYAYERVLDGDSYAQERSGTAKHRESWRDALKSFFRLRSGLGHIGVAFGEPVLLNTSETPPVEALARAMLRSINAQLMLTATHLIALAFSGKQRLDERLAESQIDLYIDWLGHEGVEVLSSDAKSCVAAAKRQGLVACERFAGARWLKVTGKGLRLLPWHKNNAVHALALPSLICLQGRAKVDATLLRVRCHELHLRAPGDADLARWTRRLQESGVLDSLPRRTLLRRLMQPHLERDMLVLRAATDQPASIDALVAESLRRATRASERLSEPLTRDTARCTAQALASAGVIEADSGGVRSTPRAESLASIIARALPPYAWRPHSESDCK